MAFVRHSFVMTYGACALDVCDCPANESAVMYELKPLLAAHQEEIQERLTKLLKPTLDETNAVVTSIVKVHQETLREIIAARRELDHFASRFCEESKGPSGSSLKHVTQRSRRVTSHEAWSCRVFPTVVVIGLVSRMRSEAGVVPNMLGRTWVCLTWYVVVLVTGMLS